MSDMNEKSGICDAFGARCRDGHTVGAPGRSTSLAPDGIAEGHIYLEPRCVSLISQEIGRTVPIEKAYERLRFTVQHVMEIRSWMERIMSLIFEPLPPSTKRDQSGVSLGLFEMIDCSCDRIMEDVEEIRKMLQRFGVE